LFLGFVVYGRINNRDTGNNENLKDVEYRVYNRKGLASKFIRVEE
jgi:hypothetical protein